MPTERPADAALPITSRHILGAAASPARYGDLLYDEAMGGVAADSAIFGMRADSFISRQRAMQRVAARLASIAAHRRQTFYMI